MIDVRNPGRPAFTKKSQVLHYETLLSMHCDPTDKFILCGTQHNHGLLLSAANMMKFKYLKEGHTNRVTDAWFIQDGLQCVTMSHNESVFWSTDRWESIFIIPRYCVPICLDCHDFGGLVDNNQVRFNPEDLIVDLLED